MHASILPRFPQPTRLPLLALALAATSTLASAQTTWYVDDDAPADPGPGNPFVSDPLEDGSALHPFDRIQEGINAAASGDTVLVDAGYYFPIDSLDLSSSLGGGAKALTVTAVAGPAATTIDLAATSGLGKAGVVAVKGETAATLLEGFTIQNGVSSSGTTALGGGMNITSSSPTIRNCVFSDNGAYAGGGAYVASSSSLFVGCSFLGNGAVHQGGGVYVGTGSPTFEGCTFQGNVADFGGGFLARTNPGDAIVVRGCVFYANSSSAGYAGGLAKFDTGNIVIEACRFLSNVATVEGGGAAIAGNGTVKSCTFNSNTSNGSQGGGLFAFNGATVGVSGTTFVNNDGGGFYEGTAVTFGTAVNCIFWDNFPAQVSVNVGVSYSDVMGGWSGEENFDLDPLFKDAWGPDGVRGTVDDSLVLRNASPCIDRGNTPAIAAPYPTDLEGNPRAVDFPTAPDNGVAVVGQSVDLGAYERQAPSSTGSRAVNPKTFP